MDDDYDFYGYGHDKPVPLSSEEVQDGFTRAWFDCFRCNEDYEAYCDAIRTGDVKKQKHLEKEFPKIAELYEDWGDIHSVEYGEWVKTKKHLFSTSVEAIKIVGSLTEVRDGELIVSIPAGMDKAAVVKLFEAFVEEGYPSVATPVRKEPKYKVNVPVTERSLKSIKKACLGYTMRMDDPEVFTIEYIAQVLIDLPFGKEIGFDWNPEHVGNEHIPSKCEDVMDIETAMVSVNRLIRQYKESVEATIHGCFPRLK